MKSQNLRVQKLRAATEAVVVARSCTGGQPLTERNGAENEHLAPRFVQVAQHFAREVVRVDRSQHFARSFLNPRQVEIEVVRHAAVQQRKTERMEGNLAAKRSTAKLDAGLSSGQVPDIQVLTRESHESHCAARSQSTEFNILHSKNRVQLKRATLCDEHGTSKPMQNYNEK